MILEKEIDGLLYSLDTDEQEATVKRRYWGSGTKVVIPESFFHEGIIYRVTSIGNGAFENSIDLTAINIPKSVKSIGQRAFNNCRKLTAINIPEGVTSIEWGAFDDCRSLTAIYIPKRVTSIGNSAFSGCSSLAAITIPKSVTSIGSYAFHGCHNLTSITIPESVKNIGNGAFSSCDKLTAIIVSERNTVYDSREGCNAVIETNSNTLVVSCAKTVIPESVTSIGELAFSGSSLTSINIPEGVTSIGERAFSGGSLTSINIPEGVTSIGSFAFSGCSSLTSILIPQNVTNIGEQALRNTGITYLTILGKPSIDWDTFEECKKLTDIYCYSEEVPLGEDVFEIFAFSGLDLSLSRITLHVPESAIEQYKNTWPWSLFGAIVAIK